MIASKAACPIATVITLSYRKGALPYTLVAVPAAPTQAYLHGLHCQCCGSDTVTATAEDTHRKAATFSGDCTGLYAPGIVPGAIAAVGTEYGPSCSCQCTISRFLAPVAAATMQSSLADAQTLAHAAAAVNFAAAATQSVPAADSFAAARPPPAAAEAHYAAARHLERRIRRQNSKKHSVVLCNVKVVAQRYVRVDASWLLCCSMWHSAVSVLSCTVCTHLPARHQASDQFANQLCTVQSCRHLHGVLS